MRMRPSIFCFSSSPPMIVVLSLSTRQGGCPLGGEGSRPSLARSVAFQRPTRKPSLNLDLLRNALAGAAQTEDVIRDGYGVLLREHGIRHLHRYRLLIPVRHRDEAFERPHAGPGTIGDLAEARCRLVE